MDQIPVLAKLTHMWIGTGELTNKNTLVFKRTHVCFFSKKVVQKCVLGFVWLRLGYKQTESFNTFF